MRRQEVVQLVEETDFLADVDIKSIGKKAKWGLVFRLALEYVWPKLKKELEKHINPKILDVLDEILQSV